MARSDNWKWQQQTDRHEDVAILHLLSSTMTAQMCKMNQDLDKWYYLYLLPLKHK